MHLIIDNYDSFTYNLFQYLLQLGLGDIKVIRNDRTTISEIKKMSPESIIISPGPGRPENAGISVEAVRQFAGKIPILGVCLGHQSIGYAFGARIIGANEIVHGKRSVTADTALRLSTYFGNSASFWLGLQMDYDLDVAEDTSLDKIKKEVQNFAAA